MPFAFTPTALPGVVVIEPAVFGDDRGFLMETYKRSDFIAAGVDVQFVQENHSRSVRGTLRGLHLQREPKAQGKLVRAVEGEVFDAVADIRPDSATYGKWVAVTLSAENRRMIYIPPGYAHGFCVLSAVAEVLYKATNEYAPELEWGARWNDPALGIDWPVDRPLLSPRDANWPDLPK